MIWVQLEICHRHKDTLDLIDRPVPRYIDYSWVTGAFVSALEFVVSEHGDSESFCAQRKLNLYSVVRRGGTSSSTFRAHWLTVSSASPVVMKKPRLDCK